MNRTLLMITLFIGLAQNAFSLDASKIIGRWKMTDYKCASGTPINFGSDSIGAAKMDILLSILTVDRLEAKIDYSYELKPDYIKKNRQVYLDSIAKVHAQPQTEEVKKSLRDIQNSLAEFNKFVQPVACSNLIRMTYYVRGNTFYTNDINNLSTCTRPGDTAHDDLNLEASTIDVVNGKLIITGGREVQKNSNCPVGDRTVLTMQPE